METIKLVSLNIEMERHLGAVQAFLAKEQPDVVCTQEVYEPDLQNFAEQLGMEYAFGQMSLMGRGEREKPPFMPFGVGMPSCLPCKNVERRYYLGDEESAKDYVHSGNPREDHHLLLFADIEKGDANFHIGTTHFIWNAIGQADDLQRENLQRLLGILGEIPGFVLCGDFNAPRGTEVFDTIATYYKDNIPKQYTTSIDVSLHHLADKLRGEPLMVDGLFTTPGYEAKNVRLQDGVSDHMAIVTEISKNN